MNFNSIQNFSLLKPILSVMFEAAGFWRVGVLYKMSIYRWTNKAVDEIRTNSITFIVILTFKWLTNWNQRWCPTGVFFDPQIGNIIEKITNRDIELNLVSFLRIQFFIEYSIKILMVPKYHVTFSSDLKNQGHPFFTSDAMCGTVNKADTMKTFQFSMVCWIKEVNGMRTKYVALMRDLVRRSHVTLQVTYLISGPIHARNMIFLFPRFVESRKSMACKSVTRQSHVHLVYMSLTSLTQEIMGNNSCM